MTEVRNIAHIPEDYRPYTQPEFPWNETELMPFKLQPWHYRKTLIAVAVVLAIGSGLALWLG